jgi:hypothetical protein
MADTYQVISDTEIRLTVPALPVGAHPVVVENALGLSRTSAELHAVQTPVMASVSLPRANASRRAIYDPLRLAIYTLDFNDYGYPLGLFRYRYVSGSWQAEEPYVQLPNVYDAAMDVDGQSLYLTIDKGLYRLELDDPTATPQFIRTLTDDLPLAVLNDGRVMTWDYCSGLYASGDGRRVMRVPSMCAWTGQSVYTIDVSDTAWQPTSLGVYQPVNRIALDRTARYALLGESLYNTGFGLVAGLGFYSISPMFSDDARRLFAFDYSSDLRRQTLRVFDVSGAPIGGRFTELGTSVMPGVAPSDSNHSIRAIVTPDGRNVIKLDSSQFYVYPLPASLQ